MRCSVILVSACMFLILLSAGLQAQEATLNGTVVDGTGAVLPGVTVTASNLATGRQFVAVTDSDGQYRLFGLPPERYELRAELAGFSTAVVEEFELLVGQIGTVNLGLTIATLEESITVTGQAPLIDLQTASVGGNIDRRQMEQLPIVGRNWLDLGLMVKGVTANDTAGNTGGGVSRAADYNLNLDGQEIKQTFAGSASFSQPKLAREAIAEYQMVTNLFDVTMGRSAGLQVQAISRSGSNMHSGSFLGFFRDDKLTAADFVAGEVLPYENQQLGGSLGGPIVENKMFYFGAYEYEDEPTTTVIKPPGYTESLSFATGTNVHSAIARVDTQLGTGDHLTVRGTFNRDHEPFGNLSQNTYPSYAGTLKRESFFLTNNWVHATSSDFVHEVKVGYFKHSSIRTNGTDRGVVLTPTYQFPGLNIGTRPNYPQEFVETTWSARYDLTYHRDRHDMKIGLEFLQIQDDSCWQNRRRGTYTFLELPSDVQRRFPLDAWNDPSRWDFSGLESTLQRYSVNFAKEDGSGFRGCGDFTIDLPRPTWAMWFGDTWRVHERFTLNLGVRYDLPWGDLRTQFVPETDLIIDNGLFEENVGFRPNRVDANNIAPRVGFVWDATGDGEFVIRGGSGIYYSDHTAIFQLFQQLNNGIRVLSTEFDNDQLPGFFDDPTRGLTGEDILAGNVPLPPQAINVIGHDFVMPHTWQSSVGFQRQLNDVTALDADLVYWKSYNLDVMRDANLFFDPATGFNRNPRDGRPVPANGTIEVYESDGKGDYLALSTSVTRRLLDNFQAYLTYTHMFFKHDNGQGRFGDFGQLPNNPFDRDAEYARSQDFQRHTLRANTIWVLPYDVSFAASFSLGSGNYYPSRSPVNPFGAGGSTRTLADGTILPRNDIEGDAIHKLDLRFSKDIVVGDVRLSGIAEVFNVYNHENFGSYQGVITASNYREPTQNLATTYLPRLWQLGFRVSF